MASSKGQKACKVCRTIYEGAQCPNCGSQEFSDNFKGKIRVLDSENSEIAKHLNIKKKGLFAVKLG